MLNVFELIVRILRSQIKVSIKTKVNQMFKIKKIKKTLIKEFA